MTSIQEVKCIETKWNNWDFLHVIQKNQSIRPVIKISLQESYDDKRGEGKKAEVSPKKQAQVPEKLVKAAGSGCKRSRP